MFFPAVLRATRSPSAVGSRASPQICSASTFNLSIWVKATGHQFCSQRLRGFLLDCTLNILNFLNTLWNVYTILHRPGLNSACSSTASRPCTTSDAWDSVSKDSPGTTNAPVKANRF